MLDFGIFWLSIQTVVFFAYFVILDVSWGTTLGKSLLGLQVTGPHGGRRATGSHMRGVHPAGSHTVCRPGPVLALAAWIVIMVTINASPTGQGKHDQGRVRTSFWRSRWDRSHAMAAG